MPNIFKADIAGEIAKALGPLVFDVTLRKADVGIRAENLTGGPDSVETTYSAKGFVDEYKDSQIDGTRIVEGDRMVVILGATLPAGIIPEPNDFITAEDETRTIAPNGVKRDPASATYTCQVR